MAKRGVIWEHSLTSYTNPSGQLGAYCLLLLLILIPLPVTPLPLPPPLLLLTSTRSQFPYFDMSSVNYFCTHAIRMALSFLSTTPAFVPWCLVAGVFSFGGKAQILCFRRRFTEMKLKVKMFLCTLWRRRGWGDAAPPILNLRVKWWWAVSLTPRLLYFCERTLATARWLGGPHSPSGRFGDAIIPGFEPRSVQPVAWSLHRPLYLRLSSPNTLRHFPEDTDLFLPVFWMFPHLFGFFKFNSFRNSGFLFRWHRKLRNCTLYSIVADLLKFYHLKKETETTSETLYLEDVEIWIVFKIFTMKGGN